MEWIDDKLYNKILNLFPRTCIDLIIYDNNKVFLATRAIQPELGKWALPGGRIFKGETQLDAINRIAREELGIDIVNSTDLICVLDYFHPTRHDICITYSYELKDVASIKLDFQHSCGKWFLFNELPDDLSGIVDLQINRFRNRGAQ